MESSPDPDFSSNRATASLQEYEVLVRYPELCFEDANIAVVAGRQYFLVHKGMLCYHSPVFMEMVAPPRRDSCSKLEGKSVLVVQDPPQDFACFLQALYGIFRIDGHDFATMAILLRMSTKYGVLDLRQEIIRTLLISWPVTLGLWELREKNATNEDGIYAPRPHLPHPILVVQLAQDAGVPELLPSAFYDLSRYMPSQIAAGYVQGDITHRLAPEDLERVMNGKEQSARFFSTFLVNNLEGRPPSAWCVHRNSSRRRRACQMAFEAVTFEVLRDVNGMMCNRNSDPLFAILDSFGMQTRDDGPGTENKTEYRTCEACRMEYGAVIEAAREEFWARLPSWFGLEVEHWG